MRLRAGLIVAVLSMLSQTGCGGGPKLVPVSGTVTLNGKPLGDADILFVPTEENTEGLAGNDKTGPEGNYKAMTNGRAGLVPGQYKVIISRSLVDTAKVRPEFKDDPIMAQIVAEGAGAARKDPVAKDSKPTEIKGEFDREVEPGGAILDFDVKAEVDKS
jgi:hypothetical protein